MVPSDRWESATPRSSTGSCSPINRKTEFSSRNATVRQFVASATRDCAVCTFGAFCASTRPATTVASTPEACASSAGRKARNGAANDRVVSSTGSVMRRRTKARISATTTPMATPPPAARANRQATSPGPTLRLRAAMATLRATSAAASFTKLSFSSSVVIERGRPRRLPSAVAATASGGATTAPMATAAANEIAGVTHQVTAPTTKVVNTTAPTAMRNTAALLLRKSTSEDRIAAA